MSASPCLATLLYACCFFLLMCESIGDPDVPWFMRCQITPGFVEGRGWGRGWMFTMWWSLSGALKVDWSKWQISVQGTLLIFSPRLKIPKRGGMGIRSNTVIQFQNDKIIICGTFSVGSTPGNATGKPKTHCSTCIKYDFCNILKLPYKINCRGEVEKH